MIFGWKKKKTLPYDPTNLVLSDLQVGFVLDFDLYTWEVVRAYEYDWGNECFSKEFQLKSSDDTVYLNIDEDDELVYSISRKIKFHSLYDDLADHINSNEKPPNKLTYDGKTFSRDSEDPGYFRDVRNKNWEEFISWEYKDESNEYVLTIEQWGDDEFEARYGRIVRESEFSNILPGEG